MFNRDELDRQIDAFLSCQAFAVAGASEDRRKYGNKVFLCYLQNERLAYPVNPKVETVLGHKAYKKLKDLPAGKNALSIITPPPVTEVLVQEAIDCGIKDIWMQPGAESSLSVRMAKEAGLNVIYGGPCLLVVLGYRESFG
jgi:predicted CoA-binding protein